MMLARTSPTVTATAAIRPLPPWLAPFSPDRRSDPLVDTTSRGLIRVAQVAIEAALRFDREGGGRDALAWMATPHASFDGMAPVEACLDLGHCVRATLMHVLAVEDGGDGDDGADAELVRLTGCGAAGHAPGEVRPELSGGGRALYAAVSGTGPVRGFVAAVCDDLAEMELVVEHAFGTLPPLDGGIRLGFDPEDRRATPFLSDEMRAEVVAAAASRMAGFRLVVRVGAIA